MGAVLGLARAAGWKPNLPVGASCTGLAAMIGSDVPMAALGISDPRQWAAKDWAADAIPHLIYGLVTAATADALDHD